MITHLVLTVFPGWMDRLDGLFRESMLCRLLTWLWRQFTGSLLFRASRAVYRRVRALCLNSAAGHVLAGREDGSSPYDGSLVAALFDAAMGGITRVLRWIGALPLWGADRSALAGLCRRALDRFRWLDFEFLSGSVILVMLLCPSQIWHNIYALGMGLFLLAALLILAAAQNRPALRFASLGLPLAAFVIAAVVGVAVAADKGEAVRVFCFFLASFLFCAVLIGSVDSEAKLRKLLAFLYLAAVAAAAVAILQRIQGVPVSASLTDLSANAGMPGRVYSVYENPNNYAEIIVLLFPASTAWAVTLKDRHMRVYALAGLLLPVAALLMTYSRGCWISFALAAVVFLYFCDKRVIPAFLLIGLLAIPLLPSTILNRILTIGSTADSSNMYRIYIWDAVMDMLRRYGLIGIGLGPGNFRPIYLLFCNPLAEPAPHSHMVYLEVWIEMGLLGIVSYLAYYLATLRSAVKGMASASKTVRLFLAAGVSSLAGMIFESAAEYIWYYPRVMFCFFILTGLIAAAVNLTKARPADVSDEP